VTSRNFVAAIEALAPALSPEQMSDALAYVTALAGAGADLVEATRRRREFEREWEESQLAGADLERRRREPA
jgi:hypothetical protein